MLQLRLPVHLLSGIPDTSFRASPKDQLPVFKTVDKTQNQMEKMN